MFLSLLTQKIQRSLKDLKISSFFLTKNANPYHLDVQLVYIPDGENYIMHTQFLDKDINLINPFAGVWRLLKFIIIKQNGIQKDWNSNAHGLLIYTLDGYMSVSINGEFLRNLSMNKKFKSILFYSGRYEVSNNKIVHYVLNASDPERIGQQLIREAKLIKNKLILMGQGDFGEAQLTWEKIIEKK